jgi:hypothetical protein
VDEGSSASELSKFELGLAKAKAMDSEFDQEFESEFATLLPTTAWLGKPV